MQLRLVLHYSLDLLLYQGLQCGNFPGPGANHHRTVATFNPMREYIHNDDRHIESHFDDFISAHNKQYEHELESQKRLNLFRHNFRFIESKNRQGLTYRLAINHLADRTEEERKVRLPTSKGRPGRYRKWSVDHIWGS
jgi:hypothetical protein